MPKPPKKPAKKPMPKSDKPRPSRDVNVRAKGLIDQIAARTEGRVSG